MPVDVCSEFDEVCQVSEVCEVADSDEVCLASAFPVEHLSGVEVDVSTDYLPREIGVDDILALLGLEVGDVLGVRVTEGEDGGIGMIDIQLTASGIESQNERIADSIAKALMRQGGIPEDEESND